MTLGHDDRVRVECARVDLTGLRNDDNRSLAARKGFLEGSRQYAALVVGCNPDNSVVTKAQELESREHSRVRVVTDDHLNRWCPEQAISLHIPTNLTENLAASGCKTYEVRDSCSCHKPDRCLSGQVEDIEQPARSDRLGGGCCWSDHVITCGLPPCDGEPISRDTDRVRASDHPAEEARTCGGVEPWGGPLHEVIDDVLCR
jgi:hypothetical protein